MCSNDLLALRGGRFVGSPRGRLRFPLDNGPLAGIPPYPLHAQIKLVSYGVFPLFRHFHANLCAPKHTSRCRRRCLVLGFRAEDMDVMANSRRRF